MKALFIGIIVAILWGISFNLGIFTKEYKFVVVEKKIYRCNERTGKVKCVVTDSGVVYDVNDY